MNNAYKRLIIPALVLVLLLAAPLFRWETLASKTYDTGVVKWEKDKWSGSVVIRLYDYKMAGNETLEEGWVSTEDASAMWQWALWIDGAWFIVAYWRSKKRAKDGPKQIEEESFT